MMKNKVINAEESNSSDLKSYAEGIIEQKQLQNSALKKILEFLENDKEILKNSNLKITSNQINK